MNYLEIKNTVKELIEFIEKYDLNDYNDVIVKRTLKVIIYEIDLMNSSLKKNREIEKLVVSLFPPRAGLGEMYVMDEDKEKMLKLNEYFEKLKNRLRNLVISDY